MPPALYAELAKAGTLHDAMQAHSGFVLAGPGHGPAFFPLDMPEICRIDHPVAGPLFGSGSDLNTVIAPISCLGDVAAPECAVGDGI